MATIGIMSDSPTLTTGFGRTTGRIMSALRDGGHDAVCFGFKAHPEDIHGAPWRVWAADRAGHWSSSVREFFSTEIPQLLILNMDGYNAVECLSVVDSTGWNGPVLSSVVFDGLPVGQHYLDAQRRCAAVLTSSGVAAHYLRTNGVDVVGVAPPGVDLAEFRPLQARANVRARLAIDDAVVVGTFGTNTERKQIARVVAALPMINDGLGGRRVLLYLHCSPTGYWRLRDLAKDLGVGDQVIFPNRFTFDERRGVPTSGNTYSSSIGAAGEWPADLSYVDRINCCDIVVNSPHSGDIEQIILEAQACGVPLVHTDDQGVMAEAVGTAGILLPARDVGFSATGGQMHHVAPEAIAEAVVLLARSAALREELRTAGLANAARYTWTALEVGIRAAVDYCLRDQNAVRR